MKTLMAFLFFSIMATGICFADDPGVRDTLIVETVYVDEGDSLADVNVYVYCDDSVVFYNLPLSWNTICEPASINLTGITYHNTLSVWDECFDSLVCNIGILRMLGWSDICGDDNPPLYTYYYRLHCMTFHFSIDPFASPQVVSIDTTYDPVNGSIQFGLLGGTNEFAPVVVPGAIFYGATSEIDGDGPDLPTEISLYQNYPNPFNPSTTLEYSLPEPSEVSILIYNLLGQNVATLVNGARNAGEHKVSWDAAGLPSGVYFARLNTGGTAKFVKMLLLK